MIFKVAFENKTSFRLKITYGEQVYNLKCGERIFVAIDSYGADDLLKVSIDEPFNFDRIMFGSTKSVRGLTRTLIFCYFTKFDMILHAKDITYRKIEIKQQMRRYAWLFVFALLTLDVNMPVDYKFPNKKKEIKFKICNVITQLPYYIFYFLCGFASICGIFTEEISPVIVFVFLIGVAFIAFLIKEIIKLHKAIHFKTHLKEVITEDSVLCLPLKFRKHTIIFDINE